VKRPDVAAQMERAIREHVAQQNGGPPSSPPTDAGDMPGVVQWDGLRVLNCTDVLIDTSQIRTDCNAEVDELAATIRQHGLLEPIVVEEVGDGRYRLVAGERRLRANRLAGNSQILALVARSRDEAQRLALQVIENDHHRPLSLGERAAAFLRLRDAFGGMDAAAAAVGRHRKTLERTIRLARERGLVPPEKIVDDRERAAEYMRLQDTVGGIDAAAAALGLHRKTLEKTIRRARQRPPSTEPAEGQRGEGPRRGADPRLRRMSFRQVGALLAAFSASVATLPPERRVAVREWAVQLYVAAGGVAGAIGGTEAADE